MIDQTCKDEQKNPSKSHTGYISTFCVRGLLDSLEAVGINPATLFETELIYSSRWIPISQWQMMLERSVSATGDPDLPLKFAMHVQPQHFGILGLAALSSRTLRDVIPLLIHYEKLITDINTTQLIENTHDIELHWHPLNGASLPIFTQSALASWTTIARRITSQSNITCDAHFTFEQPSNTATYQQIFGGNVYFNAPVTKLVLHQSWLELPLAFCDLATNNLLMAQIEKDFKSVSQPDFLEVLRQYLTENLANNQVSINDASAALGMSPRTLQYKLGSHGTSYRNLLEQIRQEQAEYYLRTTDLSLNEITFLLGYFEQSTFQNAFRRWTGESPGSFRKKMSK